MSGCLPAPIYSIHIHSKIKKNQISETKYRKCNHPNKIEIKVGNLISRNVLYDIHLQRSGKMFQ